MKKLSVWAPVTPGAEPTCVAECDTMAEAREVANGFDGRRDLRMQDVVIRLGYDGLVIERCGPAR